MKQFSIHKVNKPALQSKLRGAGAEADEVADVTKLDAEGGNVSTVGMNFHSRSGEEQPSLLSIEEQQALQPKEIKVVNPWIHEQTHKEYLEAVKVCATYLGI